MSEPDADRERRQNPRITKINLAQLSRVGDEGDGAELTVGRTLDLSRGGLRVELFHPVPLRSVVTVSLALDDEVIEITGTVVHLEVIDDERCSMGIEFTDMSAEARQLIDRRMEAREAL